MKIILPIITPFDSRLNIDIEALEILIEHLRDDHLLVNSWIGEVYSLSLEEYINILSYIKGKTDKELTLYIPSYKYHVKKLIGRIKSFYNDTKINDSLMIELDINDWLCSNDICLSRTISEILNELTSDNVMLYVTAGQYSIETIEIIRGVLRVYPEITHLVLDHSVPISLFARTINTLNDLDRKVELYVFGDYGYVVKEKLVQGIVSPIGLIKKLIENKYDVEINDVLSLSRITDYSYSIVGAIKTAMSLVEPTIKEYVRPPLPSEFPDSREYIKSVLNYSLKQVKK